jgi:hypothetical protein
MKQPLLLMAMPKVLICLNSQGHVSHLEELVLKSTAED